MGDYMEKMIIGIILCILGGAGFLTSLGGIGTIVGTITGMPGIEMIINSSIFFNIIIFIISVMIFSLGILLIQIDREVADEYRRY